MKRISAVAYLVILSLFPIQNAFSQGTITQGEWSLVYPDFSKLASDEEWKFELVANGNNEIGEGDLFRLKITNSTNVELASGVYLHKGVTAKRVIIESIIFGKDDIALSDLSKPFKAQLRVDRFASSKLKSGLFDFSVPMTTLPKRPTQANEYVKLNSDFSKPMEFPKECTDVPYSYTMNDPYADIDQVNFDIIDANGKSLSGSYSYGYRSETLQGNLRLCPYSLDDTPLPLKFQVEIEFESVIKRAPLIAQYDFNLAGKYSAVEALVAGMPILCQKGNNYISSKGNCPSGTKEAKFTSPGEIQWNALTRNPNSQKGKKFLVYGCVAQFDSNTGGSKFRAYTLPNPSDRYITGANSLYSGSAKSLLKLSKDDAFAAKVTVSGATTYTTLGGRTTVPSFAIRDFVKIGDC